MPRDLDTRPDPREVLVGNNTQVGAGDPLLVLEPREGAAGADVEERIDFTGIAASEVPEIEKPNRVSAWAAADVVDDG